MYTSLSQFISENENTFDLLTGKKCTSWKSLSNDFYYDCKGKESSGPFEGNQNTPILGRLVIQGTEID